MATWTYLTYLNFTHFQKKQVRNISGIRPETFTPISCDWTERTDQIPHPTRPAKTFHRPGALRRWFFGSIICHLEKDASTNIDYHLNSRLCLISHESSLRILDTGSITPFSSVYLDQQRNFKELLGACSILPVPLWFFVGNGMALNDHAH